MKYKVIKDCDYVQGHLRYGHIETMVEANSEQEALEIFDTMEDFDELVVDDYEIDDYELSSEPAYIGKD